MSLNLENFEGDLGRKTPVILSSPTSLGVCSQLQIEPVELVYRNLEEYEEAYSDYPLAQVYEMYEEDETKRQEKLIKCRELRNSVLKSHSANVASSRSKTATAHRPSRRYASSAAVDNYISTNPAHSSSDTESTDGNLPPSRLAVDGVPFSSLSVPDLTRSNLDFQKLSYSPRQHCPCQLELNDDSEIIASYLQRYGDILSSSDISPEDRKIMECLILKKGRELEWDRKSQELRKQIEKERLQRYRENQALNQKWHDRLIEKRKCENSENTKRYLALEEKWQNHRNALQRSIEERDKKVQKYLEEINYKKQKHLLERQKQEALRQLEVGKVMEKLVDEDRQHRQMMRERLQKRMREAETRKRRREQDYLRHVAEINRMEEVKRTLKLERLEQKTRQSLEDLRNQIEEKEHRARMNHLSRINLRNTAIGQGSGSRELAYEKARAMHSELVQGLEEWHKKVLNLNIAAQERAELKYTQQIDRRRARAASERVLREERSKEMLERVHELEEKRKELVTSVIQSKDTKTAKHLAEKERRALMSRIRSQNAAELRQSLKEKLDPETFDKKAARAELEMNFMRKTPPVGMSLTFNPKILTSKRCTCRC